MNLLQEKYPEVSPKTWANLHEKHNAGLSAALWEKDQQVAHVCAVLSLSPKEVRKLIVGDKEENNIW